MSEFCASITGGIGSGKTTSLTFFKSFGCQIISADEISRDLTNTLPIKEQIISTFGSSILNQDHTINRQSLGKIVFNSPDKLKQLEHILHPEIRSTILTIVSKKVKTYYVIEIPLLTDKLDYPYINKVIAIIASKERQIQNTAARDNRSIQEIEQIIHHQQSNEQRMALADDIIYNNAGLDTLRSECEKLHLKYMSLKDEVTN